MGRGDDLTPLFFPPPSDELGFRQGTVIAFDLSNGENVIDVGGTQLVDVPLLSVVDSVSLLPGTVVALLTWKSSWWILGRVIIANSPEFGEFCVFENNGEGVCITKNGIDIYPPNPPDDVARIFAQKFANGQMWLELIPPRNTGTTGSNRFILEGGSTLSSPTTLGSFSLITAGNGNIQCAVDLTMTAVAGNLTIDANTGLAILRADGAVFVESQGDQVRVLSSDIMVIEAQGTIFIDAQVGQLQLISATNQCFIDHTTTASAANCFIATNGLIQRSTSSLRYKVDVEDLHVDPGVVLELQPRTWRDRAEVEADPDSENWYVGFIAEELDELGLTAFVEYDEKSRPESIAYDRLSVALLSVIQEQDARLAAIEKRLAALDDLGVSAQPRHRATRKPRRVPRTDNLRDTATRSPRPSRTTQSVVPNETTRGVDDRG